MSLTDQLATRIVALNPDDFDPQAVKWARIAIADMMGCTFLGAKSQAANAAFLVDIYGEGNCLILGRRQRLTMLDAAFVNATAGHALDYDDTSKSLAGHPTVVIVPALLALAEAHAASGKSFINAYIIAVEAATRLARGVNFHHYEKGWHPTATLGVFAATVASAVLLQLPKEKIANALALAASLSCGVKANFGTSTKPLQAGLAARNGLFAALMAAKNIAGAPTALEHNQGFLQVFNGADHYDIDLMLEGWGKPLDLLEPGISIKKYPCVYSVHGAIDAAIALHNQPAFDHNKITHVMVRMHPRRLLPHVRNPATSALNAKFSLPYIVACGLVNGAVGLKHFEDEALQDRHVMRMMDLIHMQEMENHAPDYGAEVTVTLADGLILQHRVTAPLGRGPEIALPPEMLAAKFADCARHSLKRTGIETIFDLLMQLDDLPSMTDLTAAIEEATILPEGTGIK